MVKITQYRDCVPFMLVVSVCFICCDSLFIWFCLESFVNPPVPGTDDGSEVVPFTASFPYEEEESPPPPPGAWLVMQ